MVTFPEEVSKGFNVICHENGYVISKLLGSGTFGQVYLALRARPISTDRDDTGTYAIKLVLDNPEMHDVQHTLAHIHL